MSRPHLITFVGPVGVGKSTQIKYLATFLKKKVKIKSTYLKTYFFLTKIFLMMSEALEINQNARLKIQKSLVKIDLTFNLMILSIMALFRVRLWLYLGRTVLVEEYLLGCIVDYVHAARTLNLNWKFLKALINVLSRMLYINNSFTIILSGNYFTLRNHWYKRMSPDEHISYIKLQQVIFDVCRRTMSNIVHVTIDDKTINETNQEIRRCLPL